MFLQLKMDIQMNEFIFTGASEGRPSAQYLPGTHVPLAQWHIELSAVAPCCFAKGCQPQPPSTVQWHRNKWGLSRAGQD